MKIAVIGTGAYGLAIASALSKNNNDVYMYTENAKKYEEYQKTGNLKSVIDYNIPQNIKILNNIEETVKDAKIIFLVTSSKYIKLTCENILPYYKKDVPVCICSKGIDQKTCKPLSLIVKESLNTSKIAVVSGPTFAIDMINNEPVALAVASISKSTLELVKKALANDTLKLRKSSDIIGIQICGSVKNIIAIASGILGGLGYSESTQAFLINESLHDIKHLIHSLKGRKKTILSFAGVGDLLMTSMSKKSRNYSFGHVIGSCKNKKEIDEYLKNNTVEGYTTTKTIIKLLNKKHIDIPLIYLINDIIDGKKDPKELANFLITKK